MGIKSKEMYKIQKKNIRKEKINMIYDMIIVGGGPAGITAAIYGLRANKKVLVLEKEAVGGKIISSPLVENYPGIEEVKGAELSEKLYKQVTNFGGEIIPEEVIEIREKDKIKEVITKNRKYQSYTVILATGTKYKKLGLEKEENLIGRGISFCAVCDGLFYKNKKVAVIGGGNTAVANVLELANICQKVYLIQLLENLTAEPILIRKLQEKENIEVLYQTKVTKILGEEKVTGIEIEKAEKTEKLILDGIFLAIGQIPETEIIEEKLIKKDRFKYIQVNEDYMTNQKGIFAAGDCVSKKVRQLTTAINDGTIAALSAVEYINQMEKK